MFVSTVSLFQRDTNVDFPCVHKWGPVTSEKAAYCIGTPCQDEKNITSFKGRELAGNIFFTIGESTVFYV